MINAHIIGWGKYLPSKIVSNEELALTSPIDANWVQTRTGIQARHIVAPDQATSDLAVHAARAALEMADIPPARLDLIIVATGTPDHLFPASACLVQNALGADRAAAFDLSAGCSGFLYGLVVADRFIRSGAYRHVLLVGADTTSRVLNWNDGLCAYFGDGAGAVVLTAGDPPGGLISFTLRADGSGGDLLILHAGGTRMPLSQDVLKRGLHYGQMNGRAVFRFGLRAMVNTAHDVLRKAKMTMDDIDLFIPHQTNITLIHQVAEKLHVRRDKTFVNVSHHANISTAAIPVAICDAIDAGRIRPGDRVLMTAFGGGMTYAGLIWQWSRPAARGSTPFLKRLGHALWDAQAAFKSRLFHFEHQLDSLTPLKEDVDEPAHPSSNEQT